MKMTLNHMILALNLVFCVALPTKSSAEILDVEADGIYGGFWRDLYEFGPVVIDTVGGDLGVFVSKDVKMGFSFATLVGLLSDNPDHNIFSSIGVSSKQHSSVLNALDPADFSYSTAAFKTEYILAEGSTFGLSTTGNLGTGIVAYNPQFEQEESTTFSHYYRSLGLAFITKITRNLRMSWGVSYRNDFDAEDKDRPEGFENLDAWTIYNHFYLVKF